jgi:hypothetical protein
MKYFTFNVTDDQAKSILTDKNLKKYIKERVTWTDTLMIGISDYAKDSVVVYIKLKYGSLLAKPIKDFSPEPYIDYTPVRRIS